MPPALLSKNEPRRLEALRDLQILDTGPSPAFDALVEAASLLCGMPIALLSLVDEQRQWFKANFGLEGVTETPRDLAFCAHAILGDQILEVADASLDARFLDNPLVLGNPSIRFYAGIPLQLREGENVGTLCVIDRRPRKLDAKQRAILKCLAVAASEALQQWRSDQLLKQTASSLRLSEEFLSRAGHLAGVGGWSFEPETQKLLWSPETYEIHGLPENYVPEVENAIEFYAPEARESVLNALERTQTIGEGFDLELPFIRADGQMRWVRSMGELVREPGKPDRLVGAFQDITARHQLATELARQHELLKVTMRSIGDAVITANNDGITTWLNPVAEKLIGMQASEAIGQPLSDVFVVLDESAEELTEQSSQATVGWPYTAVTQHKKLVSHRSDVYAIEESTAPIMDEHSEVVGTVLVFRDVTQQRKLASEMSYRAKHDALTGLLNRSEFERRLTHLLDQAQTGEGESSILFIDLDQFKLVNDTCGHQAGDQLLIQLAKLFTGLVRASDTVARLGGDEFAILLDHCSPANAQFLAQQICEHTEQFRFNYKSERFRVGASIGLVSVDRRWVDVLAIMDAADACCYAAKVEGRNRVHIWSETDEGIKSRKGQAQWAARLEQALDDNRFVLFAQRIYSFDQERKAVHAEVLLRMRDIDGTLLMPGEFLPAAERFQVCSRIDRWVLRNALNWMRALSNVEAIGLLTINLSGQSVGDATFQRWALAELGEAGPSIATRICLEITETAVVTNLLDAADFIQRLKAIGVRVALDDFGAGASSFGYLKSMHVDFLKIDGQFVRDILTDKMDEAAVRCFIEIAAIAGMQTIAEFTETADVMDALKAMGIDFAQGNHIHKAAPIDDLIVTVLPDPSCTIA